MPWRRLKNPGYVCERIIGFSIPESGVVLVISSEGTHLLHLADPITVETDSTLSDYDLYDPETGCARFRERTYRILGLHGGDALLESTAGDRIVLDQSALTLSVMQNETMIFSTQYENFSGDWAAATFSADGQYIVLGCPYDFDFMAFERCP